MNAHDHLWAVVLAAGDGRRLQGLTTQGGVAVPKQFCALERGPSLLQEALGRAQSVAARERICTVVAGAHRRWWSGQLEGWPAASVVVQPRNRGTANGILLALLAILERDPHARIVLLPSDQHVRDEAVLARALTEAAAPSETHWGEIILLGLKPRSADRELGYIVPSRESGRGHHGVECFVEKPAAALAEELLEQGALWNAFIIAADGDALLKLFERRCPEVVAAMRDDLAGAGAQEALEALYEELQERDFSRDILQGQEQHLRVLAVPECGWSDLGTPERVAEALRTLWPASPQPSGSPLAAAHEALLSLAVQYRNLHGGAAARHVVHV